MLLGLTAACGRPDYCVETLNVGIYTATSATLCGKLTDDRGEVQVGFNFWQTDVYAEEHSPKVLTCAENLADSNNFYYDVGNLQPGTSYSYKAWAKKSGGDKIYGDTVSFTTEGQSAAGVLSTLGADNLTSTSVTLHVEVVSLGTLSDLQVWIDVGKTSGSLNESHAVGAVQAPGEFNVDLTGLDADTTYYYQAQGSSLSGTVVPGEEKSFRTLP